MIGVTIPYKIYYLFFYWDSAVVRKSSLDISLHVFDMGVGNVITILVYLDTHRGTEGYSCHR